MFIATGKESRAVGTRKKMSRDQRANIIVSLIIASDQPMTIKKIAESMGMTRSPYLEEMLQKLYEEGRIGQTLVQWATDKYARAYIAVSPRAARLLDK
jgi:hypothetical protein